MAEVDKLFVVREYDYYDNQWIDVGEPTSLEEATKIYNRKTGNGSHNTSYQDLIYYKIFPANTRMIYSDGFGEI